MSYRLDVSNNLDELLAGNGDTLGSIVRLSTHWDSGPVKKVEVQLSNLGNKFRIGRENLVKAGMFFLLFINDKPYISGQISEFSPFEQKDQVVLIGFSWEKRLQRLAGGGTRVKAERQTNGEVIEKIINLVYPETAKTLSIEGTLPISDNNGILENENIWVKIRDIAEQEGFLFFIDPDFTINFVQAFRPIGLTDFVFGRNMGDIRQELSTENLFNHITVIGAKVRKDRTSTGGNNQPASFVNVIELNEDSITEHSKIEKKIRAPQLKDKADAVALAKRRLDIHNRIGFRFVFKAPWFEWEAGAFYNLTYPLYGLFNSPGWKIEEVQLLSDANNHLAMITLEKRFPAPFQVNIT